MTKKKRRPPLPEIPATEQKHRETSSNVRRICQQIKSLIVWLGVHGLLPLCVAGWIIQRGGLSHE